jgi:hypothetical protein
MNFRKDILKDWNSGLLKIIQFLNQLLFKRYKINFIDYSQKNTMTDLIKINLPEINKKNY